MRGKDFIVALIVCFSLEVAVGAAQQFPPQGKKLAAAEATQNKTKSAENPKPLAKDAPADTTQHATVEEEMILKEIIIEAIIEKPNVAIIPRRPKPDFDEVEFIDRSFENELKKLPKDLLLFDDELDKVLRVETLKKAPAKKKL